MTGVAPASRRRRRARRLSIAVLVAAWGQSAACGGGSRIGVDAGCRDGVAVRARDGTPDVADLPLIEVPACGTGQFLAVLVTGDGGWAGGDRGLSSALVARGVSVVALDAPRYLAQPRTPDTAASDLDRILRHYSAAWGRDRAIVVGYSRGADLAPFMVSRLPEDLRRRIAVVALLGPSEWAGFHFHVIDLVVNIHRAGDLSVRREVERLRGTPVLCIYGRADRGAICPALDSVLARPIVRDGGHAVQEREGPALADTILGAVAPRQGRWIYSGR
jgi:type IV secretory pathway VirJ component